MHQKWVGTALSGRKSPGFPELEALPKVYSPPRANPDPPHQLRPGTTSLQPMLLDKIQLGTSAWIRTFPVLQTKHLAAELSGLLSLPQEPQGPLHTPVMTRGVTGQRDEEHFGCFASGLCQKAKEVFMEIPGAFPVLCCQAGFYWGHSSLLTRIFNCFFPFSNVFTAMG